MQRPAQIARASRVAAIALCAVSSAGSGHADWAYTNWKMTPEQVVKASKGLVQLVTPQEAGGDGSNLAFAARGVYPAGALRFDVSFGFDRTDGHLAVVTYSIDRASQNPTLKDWLIGKYGQPQSKGAGEDGGERWRWTAPGKDEIELTIPEGKPGFVIQYAPER